MSLYDVGDTVRIIEDLDEDKCYGRLRTYMNFKMLIYRGLIATVDEVLNDEEYHLDIDRDDLDRRWRWNELMLEPADLDAPVPIRIRGFGILESVTPTSITFNQTLLTFTPAQDTEALTAFLKNHKCLCARDFLRELEETFGISVTIAEDESKVEE